MLDFALSEKMRWVIRSMLVLLVLVATAVTGYAQPRLLPVDEAFALTVTGQQPGELKLHWDIAEHYYLYRGRIHVRSNTDNITLGTPDMPDGKKEHDAFLGDVEIYHNRLTVTVPYTVTGETPDEVILQISYQGCHEVDPKICYPPERVEKKVSLAKADGAIESTAGGLLLSDQWSLPSQTKPLPPSRAFQLTADVTSAHQVVLHWRMPEGYYLYRDRTHLSVPDTDKVHIGALDWPQGRLHQDDYFGRTTVYFHQVDVPVALVRTVHGARHVMLKAVFQGCQENGICYPPIERKLDLALPPSSVAGKTPASAASALSSSATDKLSAVEKLASGLLGSHRWWALAGFFIAGLALAFTPCVLPMVPILSGLIVGAGAISTRRAFLLSLVYVLASSLIFVIAGIVAGLAGASIQAAFQAPWLLSVFALLFVLLAFSMFGLYELKVPASWQSRLTAFSNRQQGGSFVGVAIMGVLSAFIVGPCVAPPLAAAVLLVAKGQDPVFGALALWILSLGMGLPLLVFGTFVGKWIPRGGTWMKNVQSVFGVLFLALSIWMLSRFLSPQWIMLASGALLLGCGIYLKALERIPRHASGWAYLRKTLGVLLLLAGVMQWVGVASGSKNIFMPLDKLVSGQTSATMPSQTFKPVKTVADVQQAVARAQAQGKPVMLDFYADWCVTCKEMERFTLSRASVQQAMSGFVLLRADVTANDEKDRALLNQFDLFGPPAILFFPSQAHSPERKSLRLIGFERADSFLARLQAVNSRE